MKKLFTLIFALMAFGAQAQINSFPATEGFEAAFDTGVSVIFIPNWKGSIVRPSSTPGRIFADTAHARTGAQALAAIPTSATPDTVVVNLDLTSTSNLLFSFWAASTKNGGAGDTRASLIKISTSIDGGLTYGSETLIGDSVVFANSNTAYAMYSYPFPANTNLQTNVRMRIVIARSSGLGMAGNAARIDIDDASFVASTIDIFPPTTTGAVAQSISTVEVSFSEAVDATAQNTANYTGLPNIISAVRNVTNDKVTLTCSPALTVGQFYTVTIANVADLAGNVMTTPQNYTVAFNGNTGNVKITEINYNDPGTPIDSLEFLEIANLGGASIDIGAWKFTSGITYTFPTGTTIASGQHLVIARYPTAFTNFFGVTAPGWDPGQVLNNAGETIALYNTQNVLIDSAAYSPLAPYDTMANGHGPSLVLCNENSDNDIASNWSASLDAKGTYNGVAVFASPGTACITVGLFEHNNNTFALSAYPNPVSDLLNVAFTSVLRGRYTLKVVDLSGRTIQMDNGIAQSGENRASVATSNLSAGMYLLVIETESGNSQLRFVKN